MGGWFAEYFTRKGHTLYLYDINKSLALRLSKKGLGSALTSLTRLPDINGALVSTPINNTGNVIYRLSKLLNTDQFILEISSFKKPIWRDVVKARDRGFLCISIHPLFGPGKRDLRDSITVHVEPSRPILERRILKHLLSDTQFIRMSHEEHDFAMGVSISLTHVVGLALGSTLVKLRYNAPLTKSLSTALSLVAISYSEPSSFYSREVLHNDYALRAYRVFLEEVYSLIKEQRMDRVLKEIKNVKVFLNRWFKITDMYWELYE